MEAWMAFVSIVAVVAIVLVAGGIIAFIGHLIIGALDRTDKTIKQENKSTELLDYATYKQNEVENVNASKEYDFEAINQAKAKEEKSLLDEEDDKDIFEIDEELQDQEVEAEEVETPAEEVKEEVVESTEEDDMDDIDFDAMLNDISNDVIEEVKEETQEEEIKMSEELESYSIEEYMNSIENEEETVEEESSEDEEPEDEVLEVVPEIEEETVEEIEEEVAQPVEEKEDESKQIIEELKAQLADLNRQLEEARSSKVEVVTINMTEEECVARLEMLEERLKEVKKDYKTNMKEYRPLKKVMNDLEKYQTKLRRKDTIVAKKKVALYGVNNYVDIDKEKAEKLANDLDLLEGLRLSVSHCEEVINANKDRFPILERTNQILEDQIAHIESDIASTQAMLTKIREQNGEGESENE